jgi:hypothetical protein
MKSTFKLIAENPGRDWCRPKPTTGWASNFNSELSMSLGIAFKGPEGVVLAADSRVTINTQIPQPGGNILFLPSTFDNATKLLRVQGQDFVGAVTYGVGAIGTKAPRTAHSYISEFEATLAKSGVRIGVEDFAKELSAFFLAQWNAHAPANLSPQDNMHFLVGGFDENAVYGRVFEFSVPSNTNPKERFAGDFGVLWGGQREFVDRLVKGFDPQVFEFISSELNLSDPTKNDLRAKLDRFTAALPFQFLPLQDCIDLSIFLIRTTIQIQSWIIGLRGVGGAIDIAAITRTEGFSSVQQKKIAGERPHFWEDDIAMNKTQAETNCASTEQWLKVSESMNISAHEPSSFVFAPGLAKLNTSVAFTQIDFEIAMDHLVGTAFGSTGRLPPSLIAT